MKVILLQNMPALGNKGEIKEVSDGYALNFLLPQKKAVLATEQNVQTFKNQENKTEAKIEAQTSNYQKIAKTLNKQTIDFSGKISEKNNLFESVSAKDVISAVKKKFNLELNEKWFVKTVHLKEAGRHSVYLRLPDNQLISIFININPVK